MLARQFCISISWEFNPVQRSLCTFYFLFISENETNSLALSANHAILHLLT
jgi:hypothetical protein